MGGRSSGILLDEELNSAFQYMLDWSIEQLEPLEPYTLIGTQITPKYEITLLSRQYIGTAPFEAAPPKSFRINLIKRDKTGREQIDPKIFYQKDLPNEINDILSNIDDLIWSKIRGDIINVLDLPEKDVPQYLSKHVFVAYREKNDNSKKIAEKLSKYLKEEKGLNVWYFPWKTSLGDSVTQKEEEAITDSFGAVLCFTTDFLEGKTAQDEYYAFIAHRRYRDLRVIPVFINIPYGSIPPFLLDSFSIDINSPNDADFYDKAGKIFRSLLGLSVESPNSENK